MAPKAHESAADTHRLRHDLSPGQEGKNCISEEEHGNDNCQTVHRRLNATARAKTAAAITSTAKETA